MINKVLAIETSCDDTSVAVVDQDGQVLSLLSMNQDLAHKIYGGIVPEIASRNHTEVLLPLIDQILQDSNLKLSDIDGIAVTNRPGLVGALMVGVVTAKSLAQVLKKPLIGINHLEGHLLAPFLRDNSYQPTFDFKTPFISLAVSGGHTSLYLVNGFSQYQVLGRTLDDAAGEAFDKFGKLIGLGFPGGAKIDKLSVNGDSKKFQFPRSMIDDDNYNMSFSGLKSAAARLVSGMDLSDSQLISDLCASYQQAIVDVLNAKIIKAASDLNIKKITVTGGVSANSRLRQQITELAGKNNLELLIPPLRFCTDNAAMIGLAGIIRLNLGERSDALMKPNPSSLESDFIGKNR